ncbi:MAG: hypothetical protein HW391_1853 [Chloroflexi bacterium]|nr:hypothetical protein [Chloroflexota bacterium]
MLAGATTGRSAAGSAAGSVAAVRAPADGRTGRPQRNAAPVALSSGERLATGRSSADAASAWTRTGPGPSSISTVPSVSVRSTRAPDASRRPIAAAVGCPYGLPRPAETTATWGCRAARSASVEDVRDPWWATLSTSTCGNPRARIVGSISSSMSPVSRNRCPPTSPRRTIETLLMPVPPSGGSSGTDPGSGHRTRRRMSSTRRLSPVASVPRAMPLGARTAISAAYPGPGPGIPGSRTRRTA